MYQTVNQRGHKMTQCLKSQMGEPSLCLPWISKHPGSIYIHTLGINLAALGHSRPGYTLDGVSLGLVPRGHFNNNNKCLSNAPNPL